MTKQILTVLEQKNIRPTAMRMLVLEVFLTRAGAKSLSQLEEIMPRADRITIYRTLKIFVKKGVLHTIENKSGSVLYALCTDACSPTTHQDCHPHFQCESCEVLICLDKVSIPEVSLPKGYHVKDMKLMIGGICKQCQ